MFRWKPLWYILMLRKRRPPLASGTVNLICMVIRGWGWLTDQLYVDGGLRTHVLPIYQAVRNNFISLQDNASMPAIRQGIVASCSCHIPWLTFWFPIHLRSTTPWIKLAGGYLIGSLPSHDLSRIGTLAVCTSPLLSTRGGLGKTPGFF